MEERAGLTCSVTSNSVLALLDLFRMKVLIFAGRVEPSVDTKHSSASCEFCVWTVV